MDDEINVTRREFEWLRTANQGLLNDLTNLRIELAVLKTKVAIFASAFGIGGAGAVEIARHLFTK